MTYQDKRIEMLEEALRQIVVLAPGVGPDTIMMIAQSALDRAPELTLEPSPSPTVIEIPPDDTFWEWENQYDWDEKIILEQRIVYEPSTPTGERSYATFYGSVPRSS